MATTLINAGWILPVNPQRQTLKDHTLVLKDNKILEILPSAVANERYALAAKIDYTKKVILPGFVNAHTHTPMVLLRGLGDRLPLKQWLEQCIWPAEQELLNAQFIQDGMELGIAEMLLNGTTCFSEHYLMPEIAANTIKKTGIRALVGIGILENSPHGAFNIETAQDLIAQSTPMVGYAYAPHSPYMVSDASFNAIIDSCRSHPAPIHIHMHESQAEITESFAKFQLSPIQRLHKLGLFEQQVIAVHMAHCSKDDLTILRDNPCAIVTCPDSNLKLASGICNLNSFQELGLTIAVGTDGAASNNDLDILADARNAGLLNKVINQDATLSDAHALLELLTINGAKALGLSSHIGSLEPGKCADFISMDCNQLNNFPRHDLAAQIIFAGNSQQVQDVWVNGQCLVADRQLKNASFSELILKAEYWEQKTKKFNCH